MSPSHAPASGLTNPYSRLLELAGLWSARPRWEELQVALNLIAADNARVASGREDLSRFVSRGEFPELVAIARNILKHDQMMLDGNRQQLLRCLNELCELHTLTQAHPPHLLGHVPDVHLFTGRTDRPPPSDTACEAYAGDVRALLGHLIAEQRRHSGAAVVTPAGVPALRSALADLLAAYEAEPIRRTRVQSAEGVVRAVFGGVRDDLALTELVRRSSALSSPARDELAGVVDRMTRVSGAAIWDDGPGGSTEAEHRERVRRHDPDESPIRELRQAIRTTLDALPACSHETAGVGHAERGKSAAPEGPEGGRWVRWQGRRHDVPGGNVYNLIRHFWSRDYATYDDLNELVFSGPVEPQTVRSNLSKTNKVLGQIGIPWRLAADSVARVARKSAAG